MENLKKNLFQRVLAGLGKIFKMEEQKVINRVFSIVLEGAAAAAGGLANTTFQLLNYHQDFILKSIYWNLRIRRPLAAGGEILPLVQNTTQSYQLVMTGFPVNAIIAEPFMNVAGVLVPVAAGYQFVSFKPGQYVFNSWNVREILNFSFDYQNNDLLINYEVKLAVTVEIEQIV